MTLTEFANLATMVSSLLTAFGLILLAYQVYLQRRDQRNQAIAQLLEEFETLDFRRKMAFLYSHKPEDLVLSKLNVSDREIANEVIARFEALAFKVRKGLIPKEDAIEGYWDWVVRCAQQTRDYIKDQRQRRAPAENYRANFDWLARECKLFHLKRAGNKSRTDDLTLDELLQIEPLPIFQVDKPPEQDASPNTRSLTCGGRDGVS